MQPIAKIEGLDQLTEQLKKLQKEAQPKVLRQTVSGAVTPAMKEIRNSAPVGKSPHVTHKGRLVAPGFTRRNIIKKSWLSKDKNVAGVSVSASSEAFYSLQFLEQGTKHISPQPWLEPAFERSIGAVLSRLVIVMKRKIEAAAKK